MQDQDIEKWGRLFDLPGGKTDPFATPYGPTPNCFSSNDVARMFQLGATLRDRRHFEECIECELRITRYAEATHKPMPAKAGNFLDFFAKKGLEFAPAPMALLQAPRICYVNTSGIVPSVQMEMLTNLPDQLSEMTVTLHGPVIGSVRPTWEGNRFNLQGIQASSKVMEVLREHNGYSQPVDLCFGFSPKTPKLIASCNLEFSRTKEVA